jgi:hypothetical protein
MVLVRLLAIVRVLRFIQVAQRTFDIYRYFFSGRGTIYSVIRLILYFFILALFACGVVQIAESTLNHHAVFDRMLYFTVAALSTVGTSQYSPVRIGVAGCASADMV